MDVNHELIVLGVIALMVLAGVLAAKHLTTGEQAVGTVLTGVALLAIA